MTEKHLFFIVSCLACVSVCQAQIRCYVCNTQGGLYSSGCGDRFSLTSIDASTCDGTCVKARGEREAGSRSEIEVHRGCVGRLPDNQMGCRSETYLGMSNADVCYCNTELCNSANPGRAPLWTVCLLAVLVPTLVVILRI